MSTHFFLQKKLTLIRTFLAQESYGPGLIDRGEVGHMNSSGIFFCFSIFFFPLLNQCAPSTCINIQYSERKVLNISHLKTWSDKKRREKWIWRLWWRARPGWPLVTPLSRGHGPRDILRWPRTRGQNCESSQAACACCHWS